MQLDIKSQNSYNVGVRLIGLREYTQSIHCLYYSVIQKMKYSLKHAKSNPMDYKQQEDKRNLNSCSTHEWLLSEVINRFKDYKEGARFSNDFRSLKEERVAADYDERSFTLDESADCRERADRLLAKLRYLV